MRTRVMTLLTGMLGLAALATMAAGASAEDRITLRLGTAGHQDEALGADIGDVLVPAIEKYSGGRIDVKVYYGGSLCSEQKCIEQVRLGQIDLGTVSSGNVGAFGTTFDIINLPYLFKNDKVASEILNGWLAKELSTRAESEMKMHVIALVPVGGFRQVVNTQREVKVPSDLHGLKIRVTKSPTEFNLVKAWDAVAVPYDWSALYEGLQSGVVQGMYLQDPFTAAGKFYEVVKYITRVSAAYSAHPIMMDLERYKKLPDWARTAIDKAGADLQQMGYDNDMAWQARAVKPMEGKVKVYTPTEAEMALWHKGAKQAWVAVRGTYDPKLARRILEQEGAHDLLADLETAKAL